MYAAINTVANGSSDWGLKGPGLRRRRSVCKLLGELGPQRYPPIPSGVQMEDLVHDLPLPVDFQQREQVGEPVTGPVVEFEPHGGDRANEVDAGEA